MVLHELPDKSNNDTYVELWRNSNPLLSPVTDVLGFLVTVELVFKANMELGSEV